MATRQIPIACPGHTRPLAELQYMTHPTDGTFLISACHDKLPMLRRGDTGDWIGTISGHKGAVWSAKLDKTANLAATASGDFSAKVWDAITGDLLTTFTHKHIVKTVEFSPCSTKLATGGHEGICRIYDLANIGGNGDGSNCKVLEMPIPSTSKVNITKCCWGSSPVLADLLFCACSDGSIIVWNVTAQTVQHKMQVSHPIMDMEISEGALNTLTVAAGDEVSFFNLTTFKLTSSFKMPINFTSEGGASLHPDGSKFIAGGSDLWVRVFDAKNGAELECHKGHHGPIRCLRYNPSGEGYATGSEDGTIRLWKTDLVA